MCCSLPVKPHSPLAAGQDAAAAAALMKSCLLALVRNCKPHTWKWQAEAVAETGELNVLIGSSGGENTSASLP